MSDEQGFATPDDGLFDTGEEELPTGRRLAARVSARSSLADSS